MAPKKIVNIANEALVLMIGPSSSGKTTFVCNWFPQHVIIHSDEFRLRTCDDLNDMSATNDAFEVMSLLVEKRISRGLLTVIDALNVTKGFREYFVKHAIRYKRPIYAIVMMTPYSICEKRHKERNNRPWDIKILKKQFENLQQSIAEFNEEKHIKVIKINQTDEVEIRLSHMKISEFKDKTISLTNNKVFATSVVILNAGLGEKWGNYMGIPKQLIKIGNETILGRTIRLVRQMGIDNIISVTNNERLILKGSKQYMPKSFRWTVETLLSTSELWTEWTLVLLGDVFYTPTAIHAICTTNKEIQFIGRCSPNKFNARRFGEIFALKFNINQKEIIQKALLQVIARCDKIALGNMWDLYHTLVGLPLRTFDCVEDKIFLEVHDFTDDFDKPKDYELSKDLYEKYVELESKCHMYDIRYL